MTKLLLIAVAAFVGVARGENPLTVVNDFTTNAVAAVRLPCRYTMDGKFVVIDANRNEEGTVDGEWWPENNTLEKELGYTLKTGGKVPSLDQALAFFADKPDVKIFCDLKTIEWHDERDRDVTHYRTAYVREFLRAVKAVRPDFANVVALSRDIGILETLRAITPDAPGRGMISEYDARQNPYRLDKFTRLGSWVQFEFRGTSVELVKSAQASGLKVVLAPVATHLEWNQARTMGADAVLTANARLEDNNRKPPAKRADGIPQGAYCLGYTKCIVNEQNISLDDIKFDYSDKSPSKWYNGQWFGKKPDPALYTNRWGFLEMTSDCVMMSTPPHYGEKGLLPLLKAKDGFYIEFTVSLSDFHPSHACSLWMMPTSKLPGAGDCPWFMELDVDEAKFGMGLSGTIHSMGEQNPLHLSNFNNVRLAGLDRTKPVTFGASYDPKTRQVAWWSDTEGNGELRMVAGSPFVPKVVDEDEYFWVITCRGPGGKLKDTQPKYRKFIHAVRVFVPETAKVDEPLPPKRKYDLKKDNPWKGKPNGALAYRYLKCAFAATNDVAAARKAMPSLKGGTGFYVEATFAPGADRKAGFRLEPVNGGTWTMSADVKETADGFTGRVRNRNTSTGLDLVNPRAERFVKVDSAEPVTYGISYDPEFDHVCWWKDNAYVFQAETPFVPRIASALDYRLAFDETPVAVRIYVPEAGDEPKVKPVAAADVAKAVPDGAAAYGFTKCVIDETRITPDDISMDRAKPDYSKKWFNGYFYGRNVPSPDLYSVTNGVLNMHSSSYFMSAPYRMDRKGALPVLSGKDGFYAECTMSYSRNDRKYTGAFWFFPTCKLQHGTDSPWFLEIDVDEAKFGPGLSGTVHNMGQAKPFHMQNWNNVRPEAIDRRIPHTVGAAYDPKTLTVSWWLNGKFSHRSEPPFIPTVARDLEYFLIVEAEKRWIYPDYDCQIHSIKAYVPEDSPISSVDRRN